MEEESVNTNELEFSKFLEILVKKKIAILILTILSSIGLTVYLNTGTPTYETTLRVQVAPNSNQIKITKEIVRQAKNLFDDKIRPVKNHQGGVDFYELGASTTALEVHMNKVVEYVKKFETEYRSNYYSQLQEYLKQISLAKLERDFIREIMGQNLKSGKVFYENDLCLSFMVYGHGQRFLLSNFELRERCYRLVRKIDRLSVQISTYISDHETYIRDQDIDKFSIGLNKPSTRIYNATREKLIKAINIVLIGLVLLILLLILREFSNIRDRNIT